MTIWKAVEMNNRKEIENGYPIRIAGVGRYLPSRIVTSEELEAKYKELKAAYSEGRFQEGEAGNEAARKLTELETAYADIIADRKERSFSTGSSAGYYGEIEECIKKGDLVGAQKKLDDFNERNAEWHYLQSVVFYKKKWSNESKKQLEIAMQMNPSEQKYKTAYDKLLEKIKNDSNKNFSSYTGNGGANNGGGRYDDGAPQMGGDSCVDWCCQMALCNIALNCCCNSCR